jgi:hypothetical protein
MLRSEILGLKYHRVLANSVTHEFTAQLKANYDYSFIVSYDRVFDDQSYDVIEKNAYIIDVTKTEEEIIAGFNRTGRKELRRTYHTDGLDFHFGYTDFTEYYEFYKACEHARGWLPVPETELENCLLFTATFEGEYIRGMSCYAGGAETIRGARNYSNKRVNTNRALTGSLYGAAARRLVLNITNYARENGFSKVDLGGVDLESPSKAGISNFKLSLGGKIIPVKLGRYSTPAFDAKRAQIREMGYDIT